MLVKARVNGGPPLRLLIDSGSEFLVLNRAAAARSHCVEASPVGLIGFGALGPMAVRSQAAKSVEIEGLAFQDVPLLVLDRKLADGIQGVIPLSLFAKFLIRLDFPLGELDLLPYPPDTIDNTAAIPIQSRNRLLFVKGTLNERYEGSFLLDTGAAYTAVSSNLARQLHVPEIMMTHLEVRGGIADVDAPLLSRAIRLRIGSPEPLNGPVVAIDLSAVSRYHGFDVAGLIGYSALCDSVLIVSYRDGLIRITPK